MLKKLTIRNYALIDTLDIEFANGLNIITGETGAGKSIILGALSLILGQRAETKYFFNQEKKCVIEGIFLVKDRSLTSLFQQLDLDFQEESVLRREIAIDGKSRSFVNDTPVTLATLKLIGEKLIAIHSQHATLELSDPEFQLQILDALAGHNELLQTYKTRYQQLKHNQTLLQELIEKADLARQKQDYEQFLFNELEQAQLETDEQETLETELNRLNHAETIKRSLGLASSLLSENENSVTSQLKEAVFQLQSIEKYDPKLGDIVERLRSSLIEIKDIADETLRQEEETSWDGERLNLINERLNLIYGLQQKHRVSSNSELIEIRDRLENNLQELSSSDEKIDQLKAESDKLTAALFADASIISLNRKNAIEHAELAISSSLKQMEMPQARLSFEQETGSQLLKNGTDEIKLLFSANAGHTLQPVSKVASGGELSRLMLAVKVLLAEKTLLPTIIFDEIDTGISGETALKVGDVMEGLGKNMQIISITHLPQIAAKGNSHFFVYKDEVNQKTNTDIKKLDQGDRVQVIAEMLSGKQPGLSAIQNAKELLNLTN